MGNSVTKSKDSNGYFEYIRKVRSAKLLAREKNLLYFYASMYNWEEGKASFASIELIAAWTGMSKASVNRAKKRLIELGWIKSFRRDRYSKVYVWVTNGQEDPNYDKQGFAEFHTYTAKNSVPSFEEAFGFTQDDYPSNQFDFDSFERAFQKEQERIFRDEFEQWVNQDPDEEIAW